MTIAMSNRRMQLADFNYRLWAANAERGHTIEDILKPGYWAHVARDLSAMDEIIVRAEDGSFRVHLFVESANNTSAKVCLVSEPLILQVKDEPEYRVGNGDFLVKWCGPFEKFCVINAETQEKVFVGRPSREVAENEAREYMKVLARPKKVAS